MDRCAFLAASGLAASATAFAAAPPSDGAFVASDPTLFTRVNFKHDGLGLNPREYSQVLQSAVMDNELQPDNDALGGFVEALEADFATRLGKEAAIFVPTGTLANHLAIRRLTGADHRVLVQADSHLFNDSGDGAKVLSGLKLIPMAGEDGAVRLADIESWVARSQSEPRREAHWRHFDRKSGTPRQPPVYRSGRTSRISNYARERGIRLHLDGARLFNLPQHTGQDVRTIAAMFDTVYVSLWKHFNAATGAVLAGSRQHLEGLFHERRRFGGALPGAWPSLAEAHIHVAPSSREDAGVFALQINASLLRRSPEALADAFLAAAC